VSAGEDFGRPTTPGRNGGNGYHASAAHGARSPAGVKDSELVSPHRPKAQAVQMPVPWGCSRPGGKTAVFTSLASDPNVEFRPYMEDGYKVVDPLLHCGSRGVEDNWGLFAVYDGHGGREEVNYVEAKLHELVLSELQSFQGRPGEALISSFKKIDSQLGMLGAWNSGCTCTVVLVHRQGHAATIHVANVGDSRAVLVSGTAGQYSARRVSTDHRACDPEEAQRVVADGGIVRHGRVGGQLSVSRSLGDHHLKASGVSCIPDICNCSLVGDSEVLVIASDGLWDALSDNDAGE
ncbi:unnamed protein product, partial [Polarella glacialis]